jgi:protein CpxP
MNQILRMSVAGALLLAALAMPCVARAQSPAPAAPAAQQPGSPPAGNTTMEDRVSKRITQLHAALHITAEQETLWQQFADVMRDNARKMDQDYKDRAARFANLSALENLQSYAQIAQEHADDTQRLVAAFQPLYTAMPDAQKKIADQAFRNVVESRTKQN